MRNKHPKKDIEAAIREAEAAGMIVESGRGHWGIVLCPGPEDDRCPRPLWVWSTPKNVQNHARQIPPLHRSMHAPTDMTDFHTFSLVFTIPGSDSLEGHLDALASADCDDAAYMGPATDGTFTAEFDREAPDFASAVVSAIDGLTAAVEGLRVLRVCPDDLVTVSAIADRTGRSDEGIRLLVRGERGPGDFPPAAGRINDKTFIWRWVDVARWFASVLGEPPRGAEHARLVAAINHALQLDAMTEDLREHPDELAAVAHVMPRHLERA